MAKRTSNIETDIVCEVQAKRLAAFRKTKKLSDDEAIPLLKKGLMHWDRKLRNICAIELISRLGGKAAHIILPLRAAGRLYGSCSSEALLESEDPNLIKYLKKKKEETSPDGDIAKKIFLRTQYHATKSQRKEAATQKQKDAITDKDASVKEICEKAVPCWDFDPEFPVLKEIEPRCAEYVHRHWYLQRGMDRLYRVSEIPKRSGGMRQIEAPCASLKAVQRGILKHVFKDVRHHEACHGFRTEHSIMTNASPHVGKEVVVNLDLKNFFPNVTARRVYGIYRAFVGKGNYARFLTDVSIFNGRLPQGAPTSPMLANLACIRLDRRLAGLARKKDMTYTRYADDITFSGPATLLRYIPVIKSIVAEEGFEVALPKLRIHRRGSRQEVTGLTVNQRVSVPRALRRRLRAAVHAAKHGKAPIWKGVQISLQALHGHIHFVSSIHPDLGAKLLTQLSVKSKKKRA